MPRVNGLVVAALACGVFSAYCGLHTPVNDDDVYHLHSTSLLLTATVPLIDRRQPIERAVSTGADLVLHGK